MTRNFPALLCSSMLLLFAGCGGGGNMKTPTPVTVMVAPKVASVVVGQTQPFTATVSGTTNMAVNWSVVGGAANGSITAAGVYTAPASVPNPATVTVTATSQADTTKSDSAMVTVTATASAVQVSVQPQTATVSNFTTKQFMATVTGNANTAVTWQVNGTNGGSQKLGFISSSGLYVAPSGVPTKSDGMGNTVTTTVTITAVSQADTSATGNATVTIMPDNGNAQSLPVELGTSGSNAKDFVNGHKNNYLLRGNAGIAGYARRHAIYFEQQSYSGAQRCRRCQRCDRATGIDRHHHLHDCGNQHGGKSDAIF